MIKKNFICNKNSKKSSFNGYNLYEAVLFDSKAN